MAQRKTLTEEQITLLRWIGDGCPDGVMEGYSHRISAPALRTRGLVGISGRGPTWKAEITQTGRAYLKQADGPNPPVPRQANVSVTQQLVDDVIAAGGSGELGNNSDNNSPTPVQVTGISTAIQVSAGGYHTCALLSDHTVRCWGAGGSGELGDGTYDDSSVPVQATGISNAIAISTGRNHTCALLSGGTVKCWGYNYYGQLGDGTYGSDSDSSTPVLVSGITSAIAIDAGNSHTCALLFDHTVRCWGYNYYGQLGNNSTTNSSTSVQVSSITSATAIAAGGSHTCALLSNKTVKCWGYNGDGELGDGATDDNDSPIAVQVSGISSATAISAGGSHTCVLLSGGSVRCWGDSEYGQLGDGAYDNHSSTPVSVVGLP